MTSAYLFFGCIGAAAHIVRPGEFDERIPAREQIRIGIIVGALAAVGLMAVYAPEILALLRGLPMRGDVPARMVGEVQPFAIMSARPAAREGDGALSAFQDCQPTVTDQS